MELGYRHAFRALLARVRPRRLEFGVELLVGRALTRARLSGMPAPRALYELYVETRGRVEKRVTLMAACSTGWAEPILKSRHFLCDASLGGLARWLRAAGQQACLAPGLRGAALRAEARRLAAVLLTSDASLLGRRDKAVELVAVWVPTGLSPLQQLDWVRHALPFELQTPRCMACGGELQVALKASVRERIPPRTALWRDSYWTCLACGRLFWQGTHWERIAAELGDTQAA
jgi:uncharacterized protein with PIN domain